MKCLSSPKVVGRGLSESTGILSVEFILHAQSPASGLPPCNPSFLEAHHIVSGSLANGKVHHAFFCLLLSYFFPAVISFVSDTGLELKLKTQMLVLF